MTQGRLTIGELSAALVLINTLMENASWLFNAIANLVSKKNEAAQFFEFIDLNDQISQGEDHVRDTIAIDNLEVKNLSYRYPLTNDYKIKNVNFTINKGEKVAFVGENGAGKTTFVKLLTGMLHPSNGEILFNQINADNIDSLDIHDTFSCVFQDPSQFNTFTVADNVFLGDVEKLRNDDEIETALEFSGFGKENKDFILGKDIGGTELSGGEWQKIAIARAYYRNRDFVVLDEPTSNLDPFAETEIFKKYLSMTENKTVIIVTHRISVASLADRVVVFKNGEIVEEGTHDELLSKNQEYARLYSTQAQWYDR